jgi:hypothetical protein
MTRVRETRQEGAGPSSSVVARPLRVSAERLFELARHLTERDREVALYLYRHHVLTTDQLQLLFFSSRRRAQDRLLFLYRNRVLDRFYPARPFGSGKPEAHWLLDEAGALLVAAMHDLERKQLGWQRRDDWGSHPQLAHQLETNTFLTAPAEQKAESPKTEPTVKLTVDQADSSVVRKDTARISGSVEATNAEGEAAEGVVNRIFINGFGGRTIAVEPDGTFAGRVRLPRRGENNIDLTADWPGADASDTVTITFVRKLSPAELAALREKRAAEREARKQAFINSAQTIDYDQLIKSPEQYTGTKVQYYGQIFQIQEDPLGGGVLLLSVTDEGYGLWTDEVWVNYNGKVQGAEEDLLTVYGIVRGSKSYETQIGGERYVPEIDAKYIVE